MKPLCAGVSISLTPPEKLGREILLVPAINARGGKNYDVQSVGEGVGREGCAERSLGYTSSMRNSP